MSFNVDEFRKNLRWDGARPNLFEVEVPFMDGTIGEIEDSLSERILFGELKAGEIIVVDVEGDGAEAKFTFTGAAKATMPDSPEDLAEATK